MPETMTKWQRWFNYFAWPTLTGFAIAVALIALLPQFRSSQTTTPDNQVIANDNLNTPPNRQWTGPVSYADAVRRAAPSVVNISSYRVEASNIHPFFRDEVIRQIFNMAPLQQQQRLQSTLGSGVIISDQGYLLTNRHVIRGATEITVSLYDGREAIAQKVGTDEESDLAVLKIDLDNLVPINIDMSDNAQVGDVVLAIGNPFGIGQSVSQGIISAKNRIDLDNRGFQNFMQTDATINPGNSGGALVDAYGNLLGINTLIVNDNSSSSGIGFAIPANVAMTVFDDILEFGRVVRGYLGVEVQQLTLANARLLKLSFTDGLLITSLDPNGPALQAGLRPGDVITQINSQPAVNHDSISELIRSTKPGEEVEIEYWRNGQAAKVTAVIAEKGEKPVS